MTASNYRAHAAEMLKCARSAHSEKERADYLRMAEAWTALAEGAERGLTPDEPCEDAEA